MNADKGIGSGMKALYAGTVLMLDLALVSEDQNGIAVSPDAFVEVGKPSLSLMPQTCAPFSTSETKTSALIAEMLILQQGAANSDFCK
ncbi:hypothetical protein [Rhizobium sp. MHM7A]|uniref:hypothetical protein n=1 Tax=Rhizobium sp. MHM7A TaxID=2583233 RepID=UPI001FEF983E|nr:hypothetical protein [Rhizobium sp. MHM7A]